MSNCRPSISVIMPILNGEKYLRAAIDSILSQTFQNFELLLLVEYGSNDISKTIIRSYVDERIVIIENNKRLGLPESLNVGIKTSKGKYIARMDADDIAYKDRLKIQFDYLEAHPDVDLLGANAYINGNPLQKTHLPEKYDEIRFVMCLRNCLMHPVIMWKKEAFEKEELYYNNIPHSEDYDFWIRVLPNHKVINLKKALFSYRIHGGSKTATSNWHRETCEIRNRMINYYGLDFKVMESFYAYSGSLEIFDKKKSCIKELVRQFNFKEIKDVFTREVSKIFIANGVEDYHNFWDYFEGLYSFSDKSYVRYVFGVELCKKWVREMLVKIIKEK